MTITIAVTDAMIEMQEIEASRTNQVVGPQERRHAEMAMQAAKKLKRARRQSQKKKMGRAVCHHLLRMLSEEEAAPAVSRERRSRRMGSARELDTSVPGDGQISLGF